MAEDDVPRQRLQNANLIPTEADNPLFVQTRQSPIDYFVNQPTSSNDYLETKTNDLVWPNISWGLTSAGQPHNTGLCRSVEMHIVCQNILTHIYCEKAIISRYIHCIYCVQYIVSNAKAPTWPA